MVYGKRYSRRRFRKRSYGRSYRYSRRRYRYPKSTRVRATYALRKARGVSRSIYRLRKKFDFQRYYNWNEATYILPIDTSTLGSANHNTTGRQSLLYKTYRFMLSSSNVMPYWIRGVTTTGNNPQFNPVGLSSGNEGIKPGQNINSIQNPTVQGGRFRCKSVYCRWNFRWMDEAYQQTTENNGTYNSLKVRLCVFTIYEQESTNEYTNSVTGLGDLTYSPIGPNNNNAYFNEGYVNLLGSTGNLATESAASALMIMKTTGSTRLRKVYDRTFTLNRLKTTKTCKVNLFKNKIFRFDSDYRPEPLLSGYTLYQWPFQQIYFCVMVEPTIKYVTTQGENPHDNMLVEGSKLLIDNQNVVIYYDT
ncbi:capsid protein [Dipodfec virus UA06Rod_92]|uniref:Capsid protein n=1 Tax=Dipodfec virus UA06Rod_92 TaxID=2929253 RepID=A0A976N1A1_9VIRU|nr:capsid protein [Dipodfec virus UA06Rod_92]